ncbi:MAG: hypothetical protein ACFCUQ_06380 [Kiloniellales bacterium]
MRPFKHLPFEEWPASDRAAWDAAFVEGDIFEETQGPGAHLSAGSQRTILFSYRRWLGFLAALQPQAMEGPPAGRITPARLRDYVAVLEDEGSATTTAIAVHGLYLAARLLAPEGVWTWLRALRSSLAAQARPEDRFERLVPPWQLLDLGLDLMERSATGNAWTPNGLRQYRDGLLLALLSLWPIRRRSLAALTVSGHVDRRGEVLRLRLRPEDTKAGRSEQITLQPLLVPYLERFLMEIRPRFPGMLEHDGLWPSTRGRPLSEPQLYAIVRRRTEAAFGKAMCLHDMRRAAATYLAIEAPEQVGLIPGILQQASPEVGERHYNLARSTQASRRFAGHVSAIRMRLGPARRKRGG